jgi:hypothetical protein
MQKPRFQRYGEVILTELRVTCVHVHMYISMALLLSATGRRGSVSSWKHRLATVAVPPPGISCGVSSLDATCELRLRIFHRSEGRKVCGASWRNLEIFWNR